MLVPTCYRNKSSFLLLPTRGRPPPPPQPGQRYPGSCSCYFRKYHALLSLNCAPQVGQVWLGRLNYWLGKIWSPEKKVLSSPVVLTPPHPLCPPPWQRLECFVKLISPKSGNIPWCHLILQLPPGAISISATSCCSWSPVWTLIAFHFLFWAFVLCSLSTSCGPAAVFHTGGGVLHLVSELVHVPQASMVHEAFWVFVLKAALKMSSLINCPREDWETKRLREVDD